MISPETLEFLQGLKENNSREWFQEHKPEYERARQDVLLLTGRLIECISSIDPVVPPELDPKTCVMRIYRDIRFSKDKTPFKTNFGIAISANGKNFNGPGYYVHLEPGKSFVAGGSWFPEPGQLKCIRQEIDYNSSEWNQIMNDPGFRESFRGLGQEGKLKTVPKGYPADHPDIEYLKLKSFTASQAFSDQQLAHADAIGNIKKTFQHLYPMIVFLRNAIS